MTSVTITQGTDIGDFLKFFLALSEEERHLYLMAIFSNRRKHAASAADIDREMKQFLSASDTQRLDYIRVGLESALA